MIFIEGTAEKWYYGQRKELMSMKKVILGILALVAVGVYYYITIPAINIHAVGFWNFLIALFVALILAGFLRIIAKKAIGNPGFIGGARFIASH